MLILVVVVFIAAFLVAGMVLVVATQRMQEARQTASRLEAVVTAGAGIRDEVIDVRKQEMLSSIPWLDRWLTQVDVFPRLKLMLYQADSKWTVGGLLVLAAGCWAAAAIVVYARTGAFMLSVALGLIGGCVPFAYLWRKRARRFSVFERQLPEALDMMVGAIRAGHSLTSAIATVSRESPVPISREFRICSDEQTFGLELRTAMLNLATRVPIPDMRIVVTAILIQKESGGNLAEILEKTAHIIRERFQLKRQIRVHTAQGRLTGWILAILPVLLGIGLYLLNPEHMSVLWTRPAGLKMLYGALIMTVVGILIIRKIVRIQV